MSFARTKLSTLLLGLCLSVSAFADPADRAFWIDRWLSVSYPLKTFSVTSGYGVRKDPFTGESVHHGGVDLRASFDEVYAMFDGSVERTGFDQRAGHFVTLRHGEYTVSYCHLSSIHVREGMMLIAGDIIGVSGKSGRATGPHLHLTVRYNGVVCDPSPLFSYIRRVRAESAAALVTSGSDVASVDTHAFIERYADAAMEEQRKHGIPASVTLAQMASESGWGSSDLARKGNNYFGIKCSREWLAAGKPYSLHDDDKPDEKFCNYVSVDESIAHHSRLLMGERYKECRKYSPTDYHRWLVGLKRAGYATAKDYVQSCEKIIMRYRLYLYDRLANKV